MRKQIKTTTVYHPDAESKEKFDREIKKRFEGFSAFAREVENNPEDVFK